MRKRVRLTILASVLALALAVVAVAAATYTPSMGIFQATYKPNGAGAVTMVIAQEPTDDPTAQATVYAPAGYGVTLGQPAGTQIGTVALEGSLDGKSGLSVLRGSIKVDTAANYVTNTCAPGLHEAVWTLNLTGQPAIPVYVDHTSGSEAAFSSAKMSLCFQDPTLPQGDPRRAPNGLKFLDAALTVRGVFKNPNKAGNSIWRAAMTPYSPGTGTANSGLAREAQDVVPMPYSLSLKRIRRHVRRGFYRVAGTLNVAGKAPSGVTVTLFSAVVRKGGPVFKITAHARTHRGKFGFTRRMPKKAIVIFAEREPTQAACVVPLTESVCSFSVESNAISPVLRVVPPKKKR